MARELKLDSEQTESLKTIFDESRKRYMDLSQQFWPQFETIRVETNQQIMNILRDDQKVRFEDFLKKVPAPPAPREAVQGKKEEKKPGFNPRN
jgi:DNA anti-recombination protein RmuC